MKYEYKSNYAACDGDWIQWIGRTTHVLTTGKLYKYNGKGGIYENDNGKQGKCGLETNYWKTLLYNPEEKFQRTEEYYEYWNAIHESGIKYEYYEDKEWVLSGGVVKPLEDYKEFNDSLKYRLKNRELGEPEPNTKEYLDYWDKKQEKGYKLQQFGTKKHIWYDNSNKPSSYKSGFALWRIKQKPKQKLYTMNEILDKLYDNLHVPEHNLYSLFNSSVVQHLSEELVSTGSIMYKIKTNEKENKMFKTDLEMSPKYLGFQYDEDGNELGVLKDMSPKDVKKFLKKKDNIGKTVCVYKIYKTFTTDIPVIKKTEKEKEKSDDRQEKN